MKDMISGGWRLERFELRRKGEDWEPWGTTVSGVLIYSPDGFMSVSINRMPETGENDLKDMLFYSGTYELKGNEIAHSVSNATDVKRIGTAFSRSAKFENGGLVLTGTTTDGKEFRLIWGR